MQTTDTFDTLDLPTSLLVSLKHMNFVHPTPVQAEGIPPALQGKDILATAQTGTGKTAAFGIPLMVALENDSKIQALVLAPTRELAAQIHQVLSQMGKEQGFWGALVVGGESFSRQAEALRRGADFIVATPGRLNDHLQEGTVHLDNVGFVVLDEVDRLLDMGFVPQVRQILREVPNERQTLLFSATLPKEVAQLASDFLEEPTRVAVGPVAEPILLVKEETLKTPQTEKNNLLMKELEERREKVLIFTRTKSRANRLSIFLERQGKKVVVLHGGKSQGARKNALERFRTGSSRIMVATDLAGRGIDVPDIEIVINYDLPATREEYIHRIGRTGRCGREGKALNFLVPGNGEESIVGMESPRGGGRPSRGPSRGPSNRRPQGGRGGRPNRGGPRRRW